jgi:serine phosphatase RsbU (regulator of sigma subunit)
MKRITFLVVLLFPLLSPGNSLHSHQIDSLARLVPTLTDTAQKVEALRMWGELLQSAEHEQLIAVYTQLVELAEPFVIKVMHPKHAFYVENVLYGLRALETVMEDRGQLKESLDFDITALPIARAYSDKDVGRVLCSIGRTYIYSGDVDMSLQHLEEALLQAKKYDDHDGLANCYYNMGKIYQRQSGLDTATKLYHSIIEMQPHLEDPYLLNAAYAGLVEVHQEQHQMDSSKYYAEKGLEHATLHPNTYGMMIAKVQMARYYLAVGDLDEALRFAQESLAMANEAQNFRSILNAYQQLYYINKDMGNAEEALLAFEMTDILWDSLQNAQNRTTLLRQKYAYDYALKSATDSVKNAEAGKVRNAYIAQQGAQLEQEATQRYALYSILALVLFSGGILYSRFRLIRLQKKLIEHQNSTILENINYARKIQQALLPSMKELEQSFDEIHILYEPKDVVSGDFYWHREFERFTVVACVDCTGHGVSGGFMSMLGGLILDKIVNDQNLTPAEILSQLSDEIIKLLHQQADGELQDGMDLSICMIDRLDKKLIFSGARNGITLIENNVATRYKADLLPVGGNYSRKGKSIERKFTIHTIDIQPDCWIFMYTDGFIEQPGGSVGQPMNFAEFHACLTRSIAAPSSGQVPKLLQAEFDNWKKGSAQADDVLILGFRPTL